MKKVYYLSTCSTCTRIMRNLPLEDFVQQDIKTEAITPPQLDQMRQLSGSYEALFSRRSMKYKEWELAKKNLTEQDYRSYILQEYTFLKRPVFIIGEEIFVGNAAAETAKVAQRLGA